MLLGAGSTKGLGFKIQGLGLGLAIVQRPPGYTVLNLTLHPKPPHQGSMVTSGTLLSMVWGLPCKFTLMSSINEGRNTDTYMP